MKQKIYLDTNFLLMPAQLGVDIFSEIGRACDFSYELRVLDGTIKELKKIAESKTAKGKDKLAAKMALQLVKKLEKSKDLKIVSLNQLKDVDNLLFSLAKEKDVIVATADGELRKSIKSLDDYRLLTLRQRKYLILEGNKDVL